MKELATEFNEFFTEVGVRASEEAKRLASVNGLPTSHQELPVSFLPEEDESQFRAATSFDKTKLLVLGTPQMLTKIPDDLSITLLSKEITSSKSAKNLGVTMDCNLTYEEHVTQVASECIGSLCQINRVKYLFDRRTLITIIDSLIFGKLLYCSSVWANTTKKNIELLQSVQTFAARIVSGTRKFDHVTPILNQLQWLPVIKQLAVRDATMVFKCLNGIVPPYLCEKLKTRSEVHNCNTRNRDRLHIPLCRTAAGQRAFTFRGQKLWNSLPDEFQSTTTSIF